MDFAGELFSLSLSVRRLPQLGPSLFHSPILTRRQFTLFSQYKTHLTAIVLVRVSALDQVYRNE